jgi:hypothetical protein
MRQNSTSGDDWPRLFPDYDIRRSAVDLRRDAARLRDLARRGLLTRHGQRKLREIMSALRDAEAEDAHDDD